MPEIVLPPDHGARHAALDIRQSFLVEAPAGSGKTGLLIQRFLKLLADPAVQQPEDVLAITFTRKATAEMRDRILHALTRAQQSDTPRDPHDDLTLRLAKDVLDRDANLTWGLLDQPQRLNIRTIDSISAEIARSLPLLSGSNGIQAPVEDAGPLYREAASRTLAHLGGPDEPLNDALSTVLLHRDANLANCESLLAEMLQWRDQWGELIPLTGDLSEETLETEVLPELEAVLDNIICATLSRLASLLPGDIEHSLSQLAINFALLPAYKDLPHPLAICSEMHTLPAAAAADLDRWKALIHLLTTSEAKGWRSESFNRAHLQIDFDKPAQQQLQTMLNRLRGNDALLAAMQQVAALPSPIYPADQWRVAKALFRLLRQAVIELQILFAERSECDFTEFALLARSALRLANGPSGIEMRLQHLLVDEMQDTSSGQYDLLELLTHGWDGHSQTVFLVGDPKQSIYLFRQARVERFLQMMETRHLGSIPLNILHLTANFRSQQNLVLEFNQVFNRVFAGEEIDYMSADPIAGAGSSPGVAWHTVRLPMPRASSEGKRAFAQVTTGNAAAIRCIAEQWRERPLPAGRARPWTAAVLVSNRKHLYEIIAEFKSAGVPYRAIEIDPLAEREEILDLLALVRALEHTADRTAWLALLRAPWCGLSLADLHLLAGQDDPALSRVPLPELISTRSHLLSSDSQARLRRVWSVLISAEEQRGRLPLSQWVERTWRSLGGDLLCSSDQLANAEAFFDLLEEGGNDDIETRLQKLYAAPSPHPDAVDLLTMHKAKGLEWDVVFLPALERQPAISGNRLLNWIELPEGVLLAPIMSSGTERGDLNALLSRIQSAREAAERKRLFYVAATRAREELHIFATVHTTTAGNPDVHVNSLIRSAWAAAEEHIRPITEAELTDVSSEPPLASYPPSRRIPLSVDLAGRFQTRPRPMDPRDQQTFSRPEGNLAVRAFGNTVHALVESVTQQFAAGRQPDVAEWHGRAAALLRAEGLGPQEAAREAQRVIRGLEKMLLDPEGKWILAPHPGAASETSLQTEENTELRMDRIFWAGLDPLSHGTEALWIVDFKSSEKGVSNSAFLEEQRHLYESQMAAYARSKQLEIGFDVPIRLGLYFPLLPAFIWWPAQP